MNNGLNWGIYFCTSILGLILSILIVRPSRAFNPRHTASIYLVVNTMTYIGRPLLAVLVGNTRYIESSFSSNSIDWLVVGIGVAFSLCWYAVGYAYLWRPILTSPSQRDCSTDNFSGFRVQPSSVSSRRISYGTQGYQNQVGDRSTRISHFALGLILVGYFSFVFAQRGFLDLRPNTTEYVRNAGGAVYGNTTGYLELANFLVVSGAVLFFANTKRLKTTFLLTAPWLVNQVYYGYSRYMILTLLIALLLVGLVGGSRLKKSQFFSLIAVVVLATSLLIGMRGYRTFLRTDGSLGDLVKISLSFPVDQMLGDFAGFEGTVYVIQNMGSVEPWYGTRILYNAVILPIPRLLWRQKPLPPEFTWSYILGDVNSTGGWEWRSGYYLDPWYNSKVKGSVGWALEEWGWLGLLINFLITGLVFGWIERRFACSSHSAPWIATYAIAYAANLMLGRNTAFDYVVVYSFIFFIPYAFVERLTRTKGCPRPSESSPANRHPVYPNSFSYRGRN